MPSLNGFTASIMVDEKTLVEYPFPNTEPSSEANISQRYIEAVHGATFCIRTQGIDPNDGSIISIEPYLDGMKFDIESMAPVPNTPLQVENTIKGRSVYVGDALYAHPFQFESLDLMDQKSTRVKPRVKDVGTIKLQITAFQRKRKLAITPYVPGPRTIAQGVSKEAMKCSSADMMLRLGVPKLLKAASGNDWEFDFKILATFIFHYRSRAALVSLGVIQDPAGKDDAWFKIERDRPDEQGTETLIKTEVGAGENKSETCSPAGLLDKVYDESESGTILRTGHLHRRRPRVHGAQLSPPEIKHEDHAVNESVLKKQKRGRHVISSDSEGEDLTYVSTRPCKTAKRAYMAGVDQLEDLTAD